MKDRKREDKCLSCEYLQRISNNTAYCPFFSCFWQAEKRTQCAEVKKPGDG